MKTPEQIEADYRDDYPEIHLGSGLMVSTGHPRYEDFIALGVRNLLREQAYFARAAARAALRADWSALPSWIRGPYRPLFDSANELLDEGDDAAALAMIELAEPMASFTQEQITIFTAIRAQFAAKISPEVLPPLT